MLSEIVDISRMAGQIILKHYNRPVELSKKGDGSSLTAADLEADAFITKKLSELKSDIPIISEESALPPYEERKNWTRFWLVDPLDGTAEFLEKNGEFTVNIALIEKCEPTLGVIYAPAISLLYYAEKGKGSWKKDGENQAQRIYSKEPDAKKNLTVVGSRRHGTGELDSFLKSFDVSQKISAGSSIKFCLVAEGKADIYPRLGPTMEWDVAAGDCIYRNSAPKGFRKTNLKYNKPDLLNSHFVIGMTSDTIL